MPMMGGGGGGVGGSSAGLFLPPGQDAAARYLGRLAQPMADQGLAGLDAMGGISPAGYAYPFARGSFDFLMNNPFRNQAIEGAQRGSELFTNNLMPWSMGQVGKLTDFGDLALGQAGNIIGAMNNPAYGRAMDVGSQLSDRFMGLIDPMLTYANDPRYGHAADLGYITGKNILETDVPFLQNAAKQVWAQGTDPQELLYNRTRQQLTDQVNAQNAAYGLSSSPYGSSVSANAMKNFGIDWQNNLLQRMISGGQAAGNLEAQAGNLSQIGLNDITSPLNTRLAALMSGAQGAQGLGQAALSSLITPANSRLNALSAGTGALGNLGGILNQMTGTGGNLLGNLVSGAPTAGAYPYNMVNTIGGNDLAAANNFINVGNQGYLLPQQMISNLMEYMGLGQRGSQLANSINQGNFNQQMMSAQGLGSLAGLGLGGIRTLGSMGLFGPTAAAGSGAGGIGAMAPLALSL